jgi:hypothetical protein
MNKNILKQFQFGFEIEGMFNQDLDDLPGDFKEDGSVGSDERLRPSSNFEAINLGEGDESCGRCNGDGYTYEDCECDYDVHDCQHEHTTACGRDIGSPRFATCRHECGDECYHRRCDDDDGYHRIDCPDCDGSGNREENGLAQEYASNIFKTLEDMLKELGQFKSGNKDFNHIWNKTCGLHIHIGKKPTNKLSYKEIWNATANMDFLMPLFSQACSWCDCQRKRLLKDPESASTNYYKFWSSPYDLVCTFNGKYPLRDFSQDRPSEKFRFLRFHEKLHTLEFRFLSPCEHKVENVTRLVSFLTDYLGQSNEYESHAQVTDKPQYEVLKISLPLKEKQHYVLHHDF